MHQLEGMAVILQEYAEDQHPVAPEGINKVGDYSGEIQSAPTGNPPWRNVGISFIILFVIVLLVFSLIFLFIIGISCCRSKSSSEEQIPKTMIQD